MGYDLSGDTICQVVENVLGPGSVNCQGILLLCKMCQRKGD